MNSTVMACKCNANRKRKSTPGKIRDLITEEEMKTKSKLPVVLLMLGAVAGSCLLLPGCVYYEHFVYNRHRESARDVLKKKKRIHIIKL